MGKKSRTKKERRTINTTDGKAAQTKKIASHESAALRQTALEWFLVHLVRFGVYLALFAPLVVSQAFYFPFVAPKSLFFFGLAEIVIAGWIGLMIINKKYRPSFNVVTFFLFVFLGILTLTSLTGLSFAHSFWSKFERMTGLLMWLHLVGFFLVITSVFKTRQDWQKLFGFSICAALLVGAVAFSTNVIDKVGLGDVLGHFDFQTGSVLNNASATKAISQFRSEGGNPILRFVPVILNNFFCYYLFFNGRDCRRFSYYQKELEKINHFCYWIYYCFFSYFLFVGHELK